jgi:hypothetical protein
MYLQRAPQRHSLDTPLVRVRSARTARKGENGNADEANARRRSSRGGLECGGPTAARLALASARIVVWDGYRDRYNYSREVAAQMVQKGIEALRALQEQIK